MMEQSSKSLRPSEKKKIAILLVLYNSSKFIERLVSSILNQTIFDYDFYVFDNASSDNGLDEIRSKAEIRFFERGVKNIGYAAANNYLLAKSQENGVEYAFVINPDMDFSENTLDILSKILDKQQDVAAVGPLLLYGVSDKRTNIIQSSGMVGNFYLRRFRQLYHKEEFQPNKIPELIEVDVVNGGSVMLRISALSNEVFDERYFLYGEEIDLGLTLKLKGYKSMIASNASAWHFHDFSPKNTKGMNLMYYYIQRSKYLYFFKNEYYIPIVLSLIKEVIIFPLRLRWSFKLKNRRLIQFYYLGVYHALVHKSGEYKSTFV